jgi:hypothetical protein
MAVSGRHRWGLTMKFELNSYNRNVPDEELIKDVKDVARKTGRNTVTMEEYEQFGKYHSKTLTRRFLSWFAVLEHAELEQSRADINIPEDELLDNIKAVWISLERQPKSREMKQPLSKYSSTTYENRFGSWRKALEVFIEYINKDSADVGDIEDNSLSEVQLLAAEKGRRRTKRDISERLRFSILLRDGFRCISCGRSPLKSPGVELHVDHKIPWSKGGETVPDNLETKCKECNLGKGNAFDK